MNSKTSPTVNGIPPAIKAVTVKHYRIDASHGNVYVVWKAMGSPQTPTPGRYSKLEAAGKLEKLPAVASLKVKGGVAESEILLPRQGVSPIKFGW